MRDTYYIIVSNTDVLEFIYEISNIRAWNWKNKEYVVSSRDQINQGSLQLQFQRINVRFREKIYLVQKQICNILSFFSHIWNIVTNRISKAYIFLSVPDKEIKIRNEI